ncbi:hypothetical protein D9M72_562550 [compost metagenome]
MCTPSTASPLEFVPAEASALSASPVAARVRSPRQSSGLRDTSRAGWRSRVRIFRQRRGERGASCGRRCRSFSKIRNPRSIGAYRCGGSSANRCIFAAGIATPSCMRRLNNWRPPSVLGRNISIVCHTSFQADSDNASQSPAPSARIPTSWSWTSPHQRSMCRCRRRSSTCF